MKSTTLSGMFLATLVATTQLTPSAQAASADRSYVVRTRMVEQSPSVGEYDGLLQLHVAPDGIVTGYYRPDDDPRFISVAGGITGNRMWLELGAFAGNPLRFSGTFNAGNIDAVGNQPLIDDGRFTALDLIGIPKTN